MGTSHRSRLRSRAGGSGAPQVVYNIEVESDNRYYVGESRVLVHNANCKEATAPKKTPRKSSKTIRTEWEKKNKKPWPKDPVTGNNQDVAHKKALADGGTNELDNIKPQPRKEHIKEHKDNGDFSRWAKRRKKKE